MTTCPHFTRALARVPLLLERYLTRCPWPTREAPLVALEPTRRWACEPALAEALSASREAWRRGVDAALLEGAAPPIERLRVAFELEASELELVLVAAAAQVDAAVHRVYRYAWNDYNRADADLGFLIDVAADDAASAARLRASARRGPLLELALIERVEAAREGPLLQTRVRVDEGLLAALQGEAAAGSKQQGVTREVAWLLGAHPLAPVAAEALGRYPRYRAGGGRSPLLVVGSAGGERRAIGARVAQAEGRALVWSQEALGAGAALSAGLRRLVRDAILHDAALYVALDDESAQGLDEGHAALLAQAPGSVVLGLVKAPASLERALHTPPTLDLRATSVEHRHALWLRAAGEVLEDEALESLEALASASALGPEQIEAAVTSAKNEQRWRMPEATGTLGVADLERAARGQTAHQLDALAERVVCHGRWEDLVLPEKSREQVEEVLRFARHHRYVLDVWRLREKVGYGTGLSVLFSGPPGTGKTFAAGLLARRLQRELYRVDLSQTVDKYIGETEKNLARIFDEAERAEAILLFDEADSLFANRTSVSSATDRYANLEVNYLLQRMENYEGVTILTTNFESGIDDAFMRRLRFKVHFPAPGAEERAQLWRQLLPAGATLDDTIDFEALGEVFELSGGLIKNAVLRACIEAASQQGTISHDLLYDAGLRETREQGYLVREQRRDGRS